MYLTTLKSILICLVIILLGVGCDKPTSPNKKVEYRGESSVNDIVEQYALQINQDQNSEEVVQDSDLTNNNMNKKNNSVVAPQDDTDKITGVDPNRVPEIEGYTDLASLYSKARIKTNQGDIVVEFYVNDSPFTINNFMNLAKVGFYDGTKFHRVIKSFMIQGGDPNSKGTNTGLYGTGGPGYKFDDEFNGHKLVRGSLAMANSGPNTNGSQFFIVTTAATPHLDGLHVNFGRVVAGMDVVDMIESTKTGQNDLPLNDMIINSIELIK